LTHRVVRLIRAPVDGPGALDTAVSRALLESVAAGGSEGTFRLYRPRRIVAFGGQDAREPGFANAVKAAERLGFDSVLRLAGGRAAVFTEGTLAFAHAIPDADPTARTFARFQETAEMLRSALERVGLDARVGEVPGEYCPGEYSVNARGSVKIVGIGQRMIAGGAHVGGVVVAEGSSLVRDALVPVYSALHLSWDPDTAGSVADESGATWSDVEAAILEELAVRYEVIERDLDDGIMAAARRIAPRFEVGLYCHN
jgi:octanoyl-[GcvH]:protein N-octanoyltransferase